MFGSSRTFHVPLVMHDIVLPGDKKDFEDIDLTIFRAILACCAHRSAVYDETQSSCTGSDAMTYVLTFDDGLASNHEITLPILLENNCRSMFFVIADQIGKPGFLTVAQLREMSSQGMVIGSHSNSHPDFTKLTEPERMGELLTSKQRLEDLLGMPVDYFSFPYGRLDAQALECGFRAGYKRLFTSRHGIVKPDARVVPRNSINGSMLLGRVRRTLEASAWTQMGWLLEDKTKHLISMLFGREFYLKIRGYLFESQGSPR